ncbi:MFS transporter [Faecalibacter sp. LW9]|uniref:MFS transporter n=1 Tax=Faecalibacter sp. LW9 TaxID=3103144 RepID=UPI002AFFFE24|nr:MFS transporter [Faecalibacter sp. LW9]
MHNNLSIFRKWVPEKLIIPLLIITMIPYAMIIPFFNMNSTFTASFFDVDVDDLQFIFTLAYATIVCGLCVNERLFHFFNIRSYLLIMTIINIVVLLLLSVTSNKELVYILRAIQGTSGYLESCITVPLIMSRLNNPHSRLLGNSFLYCFIMTGATFATSIVKFAIENYNYNYMIYSVVFFHIIALSIYVFLFSHGRLYPKKPLYQLNLPGYILLMFSLISGAYVLIYGKRYYWFESPYIIAAFTGFCVFTGVFVLQQLTSKKPIFHFSILRSERVILGVLFFFVFYMFKSTMSNIYQVMNVVWKWHWEYVLDIQYYNCYGIIFGAFVSYVMIVKKLSYKTVFVLGFLCLSISMLWFSYLLVPDAKPAEVIPPLIVEGLGQGLLFSPLLQYMVGSVHANYSMNTMQAAVGARYWTSTIGFSLMQNMILYLTTKHQFYMTENLDRTKTYFQDQWDNIFQKHDSTHLYNESVDLTTRVLKANLFNQSLLISNMEIFRTLFVFGLLTVVFILIYYPIKRIFVKKKNVNF